MIDWNNDGIVDPTEVVLTDIILSEDPELYDEEISEESSFKEDKSLWENLFNQRSGLK